MKPPDSFIAQSKTGALTTDCIEHSVGFRALAEEWGHLHDACRDSTLFNSWEWLFSWWQAYGRGKQLCLLTCRSDGQLVGIAPLYLIFERTGVGISARVMRLVGDGSADSDYLDFLVRPDMRTAVLSVLCERLVSDSRWDVLALRALPESSLLPAVFRRIAVRRKLSLRVEHALCAALKLPKTFNEFLQGRQPRFRTKLRALLKKLDKGDLQVDVHVAPGALRRRLRSLFALHQARWRGTGAQGVFNEPRKRNFYARFAPRFARRGWLRLYSLRCGESYLAHQLCFGAHGVTYLLQEGFDVSDPSASYGQMLRAAVMRHLIEQGGTRYDFLGGTSRHKQDWGAAEGKIVHLVVAQRRPRAWLYFNLPLWRDWSANAVKRWLPAPAVRMLKRIRWGEPSNG
jgi:CelD/BcsL family acetyltransferase involved in cellulose biosynthesis